MAFAFSIKQLIIVFLLFFCVFIDYFKHDYKHAIIGFIHRRKPATPPRYLRSNGADSQGYRDKYNGRTTSTARSSGAYRNARPRNDKYSKPNQNYDSSSRAAQQPVAQNHEYNRYNGNGNERKESMQKQSNHYAQTIEPHNANSNANANTNGYFKGTPKVEKIVTAKPNDIDEIQLANLRTSKIDSSDQQELDLRLMLFDEDKIEFGVDLPEISVSEQFKPGQSFRIFLATIHSPYKFWFQLNEHSDQIGRLMSGLEYVEICFLGGNRLKN